MKIKQNSPVMWKKKEYRFVRYPIGTLDKAVIVTIGEENRQWLTVPVEELDLILEFDFMK